MIRLMTQRCFRVRTASVDVIEALVAAGADPNCKNVHTGSITPLTLVLLRGAAITPTGMHLLGTTATDDNVSVVSSIAAGHPHDLQRVDSEHSIDGIDQPENNISGELERNRVAGKRVWIKAADVLLRLGNY